MTSHLGSSAALLVILAAVPASRAQATGRSLHPAMVQQAQGFGTHAAVDRAAIHLSPISPNGTGLQGPTGNIGGPPPPVVTPEPISLTLLATGLAGVGGLGLRRRRKGPTVGPS